MPLYQIILFVIAAIAVVAAIANIAQNRDGRSQGRNVAAQILFLPVVILAIGAIFSEIVGWGILFWKIIGYADTNVWPPLNAGEALYWAGLDVGMLWPWSSRGAAYLSTMDAAAFFTVVLPFSLLIVMVMFVVLFGFIVGFFDEEVPDETYEYVLVRRRRRRPIPERIRAYRAEFRSNFYRPRPRTYGIDR